MKLESRFDEGDIISCTEICTNAKRFFKVLFIQSWGDFNGFKYRCVEVDKNGDLLEMDDFSIDDEDLNMFFKGVRKVKPKAVKKIEDPEFADTPTKDNLIKLFMDGMKNFIGDLDDDGDKDE